MHVLTLKKILKCWIFADMVTNNYYHQIYSFGEAVIITIRSSHTKILMGCILQHRFKHSYYSYRIEWSLLLFCNCLMSAIAIVGEVRSLAKGKY